MTQMLVTTVVPHAGTWIEIKAGREYMICALVVPHAGTWIEILQAQVDTIKIPSFPTRERGLKFLCPHHRPHVTPVVPHAGTWIEIILLNCSIHSKMVVPHAGTWIEISNSSCICGIFWSFPTRERGLKYCLSILCMTRPGRSPRGNVD